MIKEKLLKRNALLAIIAILLLFILLCYGMGLDETVVGDSIFDTIGKGADDFFFWSDGDGTGNGNGNGNGANGNGDDDNGDDDDDDDNGEEQHWEGDSGGGGLGIGAMSTEYADFGDCPPFTPGGGDIIVEFYHTWSVEFEHYLPCEPGVEWCVHDSTGTRVFHSVEPMPVTATESLSGTWDGLTPWTVVFTNFCYCDVTFSWSLTVYWTA